MTGFIGNFRRKINSPGVAVIIFSGILQFTCFYLFVGDVEGLPGIALCLSLLTIPYIVFVKKSWWAILKLYLLSILPFPFCYLFLLTGIIALQPLNKSSSGFQWDHVQITMTAVGMIFGGMLVLSLPILGISIGVKYLWMRRNKSI